MSMNERTYFVEVHLCTISDTRLHITQDSAYNFILCVKLALG